MAYVRVKSKYQVTIPNTLRAAIGIHEGDLLEAKLEDGHIVLVPQMVHEREQSMPTKKTVSPKSSPLLAMIGANAGSGLYQSAEAIDDYIRSLREEWEIDEDDAATKRSDKAK